MPHTQVSQQDLSVYLQMRTKQTPRGSSSSHRPKGMATARFTGSTEAEAEQFKDTGGSKSQDSQEWLDFDNPKAAKEGKGELSWDDLIG